jgi:hypothetical protein
LHESAGELAGTDVIMPFSFQDWGTKVIPDERIDDQVIRVLLPYFALDQDKQYPKVDLNRYVVDGGNSIYRAGVESVTLLKNRDRNAGEKGGLPLPNQDVGGEHVCTVSAD